MEDVMTHCINIQTCRTVILALDGREGEPFINDINKLLYMETLHSKWLE